MFLKLLMIFIERILIQGENLDSLLVIYKSFTKRICIEYFKRMYDIWENNIPIY